MFDFWIAQSFEFSTHLQSSARPIQNLQMWFRATADQPFPCCLINYLPIKSGGYGAWGPFGYGGLLRSGGDTNVWVCVCTCVRLRLRVRPCVCVSISGKTPPPGSVLGTWNFNALFLNMFSGAGWSVRSFGSEETEVSCSCFISVYWKFILCVF